MYSSKEFIVSIDYQGVDIPDCDDIKEMLENVINDSWYWKKYKKFSLGSVVDIDNQEV